MSPKKKKTYFAVVLIGAFALVVNSFVLSSDLAEAGLTPYPAGAEQEAPIAMSDLAIPELPFPQGIKSVDVAAEMPDLFSPPKLMENGGTGDRDTDKLAIQKGSLSVPGRLSSGAFLAAHRLNGILVDERLKIAGIDGQWFRIRAVIDGCTLVHIAPREVVFECFDNEVTLVMQTVETNVRH
jgi:hypothetical protein